MTWQTLTRGGSGYTAVIGRIQQPRSHQASETLFLCFILCYEMSDETRSGVRDERPRETDSNVTLPYDSDSEKYTTS